MICSRCKSNIATERINYPYVNAFYPEEYELVCEECKKKNE